MRRLKVAACVAAASISFAGCFSVEVAPSTVLGEGVEKHITVENYGWYLLGCVPLVCGNEKLDSWCAFSIFCDEVRPEIAYSKMKDVARREGYEITDFHVINDNDVLQVEAYSVTIPWLVVRKEVSLSANLAKKGGLK